MTGVRTDAPRDLEELIKDSRRRLVALERRRTTSGSGGGGGGGGDSDVVAGFISPFAGASAPTGWLMCDGAAYSPTAFPELYAAIGVTYGGTAAAPLLPNLKGRIPVGKDAAQAEFDVLGETGGTKTETLTIAQMPRHQHNHNQADGGNMGYIGDGSTTAFGATFQATRLNTDIMTGNTGGGSAHNNLQPYLTLNYIIATGFGSSPSSVGANPLPPPVITVTGGTGPVTATTFTAIPNYTPITLVLSAPAWVEVTFQAWLSMTSTVGELRAGVALSGAITQAPNATQAGSASWGAVAIRSGVQGAGSEQYMVSKTVLVPAGTTVFTPQAYINGGATGTNVNYGVLTVTPTAWDGASGAVVAPSDVALPSSVVVTGSGATYNIDSKGNINFSNCATITINGVFLSDSKTYDVDYDLAQTASGGPIFQFTTAGVAFTNVANYTNQRTYSAGTTAAQGSNVNNSGQINPAPVGGLGHMGRLRFIRPASANYTDWIGDSTARGGSNPIGTANVSGFVNTSNVFDGVLLYANIGTISGSIRFRKLFD